jgi:hypothetical protein
MNNKKAWQSKTLWVNLVLAIVAFFPVVQEQVALHPEYVGVFFAVVNMLLRVVTKDKLQLKDDPNSITLNQG